MKTNLSIKFKDNKELQSFIIQNADIVDMSSIQGPTLSCLDKEFIVRFKQELNMHKLFIQSIKKGDIDKINFCMDNDVNYNDELSMKEAELIARNTKHKPIFVAYDYGHNNVIEMFLDYGILSYDDIYEFVCYLIESFRSIDSTTTKLSYALYLIDRLIDDYDLDPDYNGGEFLNSAVEGTFALTIDLLEMLVSKGVNVTYLELFYIKGAEYNLKGLRYLNQFMDENSKIDVDFFLTGKFSETKRQ